MSTEALSLLILDDEKALSEEIFMFLSNLPDAVVFEASRPSEAYKILEKESVDVAIVDIRLPEESGLTVLENIKRLYPETEVIMISAHGDMDIVIECMRRGAFDYFSKPFMLKALQATVERTRKFVEMRKRLADAAYINKMMRESLESGGQPLLIGQSKSISEIRNYILRIAKNNAQPVLITGETGTGKEIVAHQIHSMSDRQEHPFLAFNCSAVPEQLFESEIFGYKRGAFSGAETDKPGWFELADKGTLLLDEIGDMPLHMQAKLMRVLEEKRIWKLGASQPVDVDVRVLAATNRPLDKMIEKGTFRDDLFYRLNLFQIKLPPLRERKEDIPELVAAFVDRYSVRLRKKKPDIHESVYRLLSNYDFPGNIRQLRNMVERAVILSSGNILTRKLFFSDQEIIQKGDNKESQLAVLNLAMLEKSAIERALEIATGNKTRAASLLGITPQSLLRRLSKYSLD